MLSLSTLPREVRDLVYHELWRMTPSLRFKTPLRLRYRPRDHHRFCSLRRPTRRKCTCAPTITTPGLPLWLMTSKSMLSEGLNQLFRYAIWQWSASDQSAPPEYLLATPNPLAGLAKATNLSISESNHGHGRNGCKGAGNIMIDYSKHQLRTIDHMLPLRLKTLRLDVSIHASVTRSISLDLSELKPKGLIVECIAISFKLNLLSGPLGLYEAKHSIFVRDVKDEVSRVGKLWLCEDGERELEMAMEKQWLQDDIVPQGESNMKFQMSMVRFQVAQKGMLGKVKKNAERMMI